MPAQRIRAALATVLDGLPVTGSRVYRSRSTAMEEANLPGIRLATREEESENLTLITPALQENKVRVIVECCGKTSDDLDDLLDQMAKEVENRISLNQTLGGMTRYIQLQSTEIGLRNEAEKPIGVCSLVYEALYLASEDAPDVSL